MPEQIRLVYIAGREAWHIYHTRPGKERIRVSTRETDRAAAERFLADYIASLKQPPPGQVVTIATVLDRYLDDRKDRNKPGATRLEWAHKQLKRHLGEADANTFTAQASRDYARNRASEGVSRGTVRTELEALRAATRWAANEGELIDKAPNLTLPPRPEGRQRWLTRDEADRLLAACIHRHVRLFVLLALHTGARRGAILDLTWDRVDLENRLIDFRQPGAVRSKKRRVPLPINDDLYEALAEAKAVSSSNYVISHGGSKVASVRHGIQNAGNRAGVPGVTPHVFRHTAATWMAQKGIAMWDIAGMLGNTVEMVSAVYGHHSPDHLKAAAKALNRNSAPKSA